MKSDENSFKYKNIRYGLLLFYTDTKISIKRVIDTEKFKNKVIDNLKYMPYIQSIWFINE